MLSRRKRDLTMAEAARGPGNARVDHLLVADMIAPQARVLDVGCGDGELLRLLETRGVDGRGIELSREGVNECVAKGLAVVQGDADTDLADYPDDAFDFVILSQTLQATRQPRVVLEHMLRIGRHGIVSFPNFGHWKIRLQVALGGRGSSSVIGHREQLPLRDAALVNGALLHGLDFDDTHLAAIIHPTVTCLPAALGVAEAEAASGADMLAAYIAGMECAIRIGASAKGGFHHVGFHATGIIAHFAAALVA